MMTLYYNPRPSPVKVALYLEEAELEYDIAPVDLLVGEHRSDEFRALNPNAKVPVLVDDAAVVFQYGNSALPGGPSGIEAGTQAMHRFWLMLAQCM